MDKRALYVINEINEKLKGRDQESKRRLLCSLLVFFSYTLRRAGKRDGADRAAVPGTDGEQGREALRRLLEPGRRIRANEGELRAAVYEAMREMREREPESAPFLEPEAVLEEIGPAGFERIFALLAELCVQEESGAEEALIKVFERFTSAYIPALRGRRCAEEFYAPRQVVQYMVRLLEPVEGSVYDPVCGSGGLLLSMADYIAGNGGRCELYGQELSEEARKMAAMNLFLHGFHANLGGKAAAALKEDLHPELWADYVVGNPPFGAGGWRRELDEWDPRWKYGLPPKNRGGLLWMQHMLWHLKENGRMALLLNTGALDSQYAGEKNIRRGIVRDDLIEAIVLLPAGVFYGTRTETALWLISKRKHSACAGRILFMDGSGIGREDGSGEELERLCAVCRAYRQGMEGREKNFFTVAFAEQVEAAEYSLDPRSYISYEKEEPPEKDALDREEERLEERLGRLSDECALLLDELMEEIADAKDW